MELLRVCAACAVVAPEGVGLPQPTSDPAEGVTLVAPWRRLHVVAPGADAAVAHVLCMLRDRLAEGPQQVRGGRRCGGARYLGPRAPSRVACLVQAALQLFPNHLHPFILAACSSYLRVVLVDGLPVAMDALAPPLVALTSYLSSLGIAFLRCDTASVRACMRSSCFTAWPGPRKSAPQQNSELEGRNISQIRALRAQVRTQIRPIELRAGHGRRHASTSYSDPI